MKTLFIFAIGAVLMGGCARTDKAETQRLFKECMEQSKTLPKPGLKLLDSTEDVISACEGYAQRNS